MTCSAWRSDAVIGMAIPHRHDWFISFLILVYLLRFFGDASTRKFPVSAWQISRAPMSGLKLGRPKLVLLTSGLRG
jgi:hypothetical protein